ncbi:MULTISPECIES: glycosyltransferase family 4 protein [unclassified Agrococcus]|uniref:glycosyltransferase family 4 protein n=1 Tax=unclassified Agrococcus TaxID=2615065 RepID=UPI003621B1AB
MTDREIRVAFDDQAFVAQQRGGVSKMFVETALRLPEHGVEPVLLSRTTRNEHLAASGLVPRRADPGALRARAEWFGWRVLGRPREQGRALPPVDLVHHTFTHPSYLRPLPVPRVMSVYDFMPERFPKEFPLGNPHFAKRRFVEAADLVLSISEATLADLRRFYGDAAAEHAVVVPLGVADAFLDAPRVEIDLPERYLLFVGVRRGYKDFDVFVEAATPLLAEEPALHVVLVGGGPLSDDEQRMLAAAGIADRVARIAPSDAEMPTVYARADALAFPSRYEGFGLPTLEALATGTPVVVVDAGVGREVGGDVALYFPAGDAVAMRERLREARTERVAAHAREAGPRWARAFTWDATARRTADAYRALLDERR